MIAIQHIYCYLQSTKDLKTMYYNSFTQYPYLEVNTNIDWIGNKVICKLNSTYITILKDCLVFYSSKKQTIITQFSMEVE